MENTVKRPATIDFNRPCRYARPAPSLVTPILALSTPELTKMISCEELAVLTPNGISSVIPQANNNNSNNVIPSPLIPTTVNSNNIINNTNNCMNNGNNIDNNDQNTGQKQIKRESDRSNDLDVEKIEKKRERNRLAAKKCRQRKLETIDELRKTVSDWEQKYEKLEMEFQIFRAQRNKEIELLRHENSKLKEFNQTVM